MKNFNLKKDLLPHLLVVLAFLVLTFAFFSPLLKGNMGLQQQDVRQWQGMYQGIKEYNEATGSTALWTYSMFSGMPAYQIYLPYVYDLFIVKFLYKGFVDSLPHPANSLFLYMLGFYMLLLAYRTNKWIAAIGAIAFAFSSYNFIIIEAGHVTKTIALGLAPLVLAGIVFSFRSKYWLLAAALTALALAFQIKVNHVQITYYLLITTAFLGIAELIWAAKKEMLPSFARRAGVLIVAGLLGAGANATNLFMTQEYGKETIRGESELSSQGERKSTGLDYDYALGWSYGIDETLTLLIPNAFGGSSMEGFVSDAESTTLQALRQNPKVANELSRYTAKYWGAQPFTSGPVYIGAIVVFLFILGLFVIKGPEKWWLLAATIISIMMAWGRNFTPLTDLLFHYLPFYNKFRAVAMSLVIAQITMPLLGMLALYKVFYGSINRKKLEDAIKYSFFIVGGLCLVFAIMPGLFFDFVSEEEVRNEAIPAWLRSALAEDRQSEMVKDAFRSFIFIALAAAALFFYARDKVKLKFALAAIAVLILVDLWAVDKRYLNEDKFERQRSKNANFVPTQADQAILQDPGKHYRVINLTVDPFKDASTSYFHRSVGGYHGAKLKRYDELWYRMVATRADKYPQYLPGEIQKLSEQKFNEIPALNMLNTKYIIFGQGANEVLQNPNALGPAWFVDSLRWAPNADAEIAGLHKLKPQNTAIIDERFRDEVGGEFYPVKQGAQVTLQEYVPDYVKYSVNTQQEGFMVMSEVYYNSNKGWQAYINGEPAPHVRVNYILRGMKVPAGEHTIEFKFEPKTVQIAGVIALTSSLLLILFLGGAIVLVIKRPEDKDGEYGRKI